MDTNIFLLEKRREWLRKRELSGGLVNGEGEVKVENKRRRIYRPKWTSI